MIVPPSTKSRSAITALPLSSYDWIVQKLLGRDPKPSVIIVS
jgi:hypothetical protein